MRLTRDERDVTALHQDTNHHRLVLWTVVILNVNNAHSTANRVTQEMFCVFLFF